MRDLRTGGERRRGKGANVAAFVRKRTTVDVDGLAGDSVRVSDQDDCLDSL